jgi:hypothetical protein
MCGTRTYVTQVGDLLDLVRCRTVGRQRLYRINGAALVTVPSDLEIRIERAFDAPADLVFKAWTIPESVRRRWGDEQAPVVSCDIDLHPAARGATDAFIRRHRTRLARHLHRD